MSITVRLFAGAGDINASARELAEEELVLDRGRRRLRGDAAHDARAEKVLVADHGCLLRTRCRGCRPR